MKELNIEIAVKIYDYEELDAADRELMDGDRDAVRRLYRYPYQSGYRLRSRGGLLPSFLIRLYPLGKSLVREE